MIKIVKNQFKKKASLRKKSDLEKINNSIYNDNRLISRISKRNSINFCMHINELNEDISSYKNLIKICEANLSKAVLFAKYCIEKQKENFLERFKIKKIEKMNKMFGNDRKTSFIKRETISTDFALESPNKYIRGSLPLKTTKNKSLFKISYDLPLDNLKMKKTSKKQIENSVDSYIHLMYSTFYSEFAEHSIKTLINVMNDGFKQKVENSLQYNDQKIDFELMLLDNMSKTYQRSITQLMNSLTLDNEKDMIQIFQQANHHIRKLVENSRIEIDQNPKFGELNEGLLTQLVTIFK